MKNDRIVDPSDYRGAPHAASLNSATPSRVLRVMGLGSAIPSKAPHAVSWDSSLPSRAPHAVSWDSS